MDPELKAYLEAMEARILAHIDLQLKTRSRQAETMDLKLRQDGANLSALGERLSAVEERLMNLEFRPRIT